MHVTHIGKRISAEKRVSCRSTVLAPRVYAALCAGHDYWPEHGATLDHRGSCVLVKPHHSVPRYCSTCKYASTLRIPGCVLAVHMLSIMCRVWTWDSSHKAFYLSQRQGAKYVLQSTDLQVGIPEVRVCGCVLTQLRLA